MAFSDSLAPVQTLKKVCIPVSMNERLNEHSQSSLASVRSNELANEPTTRPTSCSKNRRLGRALQCLLTYLTLSSVKWLSRPDSSSRRTSAATTFRIGFCCKNLEDDEERLMLEASSKTTRLISQPMLDVSYGGSPVLAAQASDGKVSSDSRVSKAESPVFPFHCNPPTQPPLPLITRFPRVSVRVHARRSPSVFTADPPRSSGVERLSEK